MIEILPNLLVSEDGMVFYGDGTQRKLIKRADGYLTVWYNKSHLRVHRLVASAYLGLSMQDSHTQVHHKDGDKKNNAVINLALLSASGHSVITRSENGCNTYTVSPDDIVDSLTRTGSLAESARELGFASQASLTYYYQRITGNHISSVLSVAKKDYASRLTERIESLVIDVGWTRAAEILGKNLTTLRSRYTAITGKSPSELTKLHREKLSNEKS